MSSNKICFKQRKLSDVCACLRSNTGIDNKFVEVIYDLRNPTINNKKVKNYLK